MIPIDSTNKHSENNHMAMWRVVGSVIDKGVTAMLYGKEEAEIREDLRESGWTDDQANQLLRAMNWRIRAETSETVTVATETVRL